jgi:hypothetical protein
VLRGRDCVPGLSSKAVAQEGPFQFNAAQLR